MSTDLHDIAVVGAGPAGSTAAVLLAQQGHSVVLVDRRTFPRKPGQHTWLSARATPLLEQLGIDVKPLTENTFDEISFYKADFTQTATPKLESSPGYIVDRSELDNMLVSAAKKPEITCLLDSEVASVQQKESSVVLGIEGATPVEARLIIVASGKDTGLPELVGIPPGRGTSMHWSAQVEKKLDKKTGKSSASVGIVLGLDTDASFGTYYVTNDRVSVGLLWRGPKVKLIPTLVHLCQQGLEHEILPVDLSDEARGAKAIQGPRSYALDLDTHVGKHALVVGEAGGFISAASHEGIYPAMWSAQIAADVAGKALASVHSQDTLMEFNSAWRIEMAEYLRPPHTDIQFLLPLIFSNQPMADRMGAAFFLGDNI